MSYLALAGYRRSAFLGRASVPPRPTVDAPALPSLATRLARFHRAAKVARVVVAVGDVLFVRRTPGERALALLGWVLS